MAAEAGAAESAAVALEGAEASLAELADTEDYYFGPHKEQKIKNAADTAVACAETALTCVERPSSATHAKACCIKGRALSFLPGKEKQAEELLSKALKLDPQLVDAWNALGEVFWNQANYSQAKTSFEQAITLCGSNSTSLRSLSMVLRALDCRDDAERAANYASGLQKAKEATVLDANDPQNWETLGNAYMGEFFVTGRQYKELTKALTAYSRAEAFYEKLGKRNPTLHMNRGTAAKYLEDYDLALRSFKAARDIGAARGSEELDKVVEIVKRLAGTVERKGDLKAKRLKELTVGMSQAGTLAQMKARGNEDRDGSIVAKVVSVVDRKDEVPVIVCCCDADGQFFALSVYNAEQAKIVGAVVPLQTTIEIKRPHARDITCSVKDVSVSYPSVRVAHPGDIAVCGGDDLSSAAVLACFSSAKAGV